MLLRIAQLRIPAVFLYTQHEGTTKQAVDRLAQQIDFAEHLIVERRSRLCDLHHAAHRIAPVQERSRPFPDINLLHIESIYFEPVVGTPLLPFLLDAVLRNRYPVETHTTDHRLGKAGTDIHRMNPGKLFQSLHQIAGEMLF